MRDVINSIMKWPVQYERIIEYNERRERLNEYSIAILR